MRSHSVTTRRVSIVAAIIGVLTAAPLSVSAQSHFYYGKKITLVQSSDGSARILWCAPRSLP